MINVLLPKNITIDPKDLTYLISIYDYLKSVKNNYIVFDCKDLKFIEANICAFLATLNEHLFVNSNVISYINVNPKVEEILKRNSYLQSKKNIKHIAPNEDTTITYKSFKLSEEANFNLYLNDDLFGKDYFPKQSIDLQIRMQRCIYELFDNSRIHGKCKLIHACGQYFPNKRNKPLHFSLVNLGNTIKSEVTRYLKQDLNGYESIEWALQKGNTTKTGNTSGGLGLDVLMNFINLNNGYMQIISDDGYLEYGTKNNNKKILDFKFDGTFINLVFYMEDKSYYSLDDSTMVTIKNIF